MSGVTQPGAGEPEEDVGAHHRLGQRARRGVGGVARLVLVHVLGAALVDHALGVAHDDVLQAHAQADVVGGAGNGGGAGAVEDDLDFGDILAADFERVEQARAADDRGAVLIVVEDRDLHRLDQRFLDVEALRRLDVFQIDAAEGGLENLAGADDFIGVLGVELDIEDVDIGEALEQDGLAFHYRLAGEGADVAESEHRGAVADTTPTRLPLAV